MGNELGEILLEKETLARELFPEEWVTACAQYTLIELRSLRALVTEVTEQTLPPEEVKEPPQEVASDEPLSGSGCIPEAPLYYFQVHDTLRSFFTSLSKKHPSDFLDLTLAYKRTDGLEALEKELDALARDPDARLTVALVQPSTGTDIFIYHQGVAEKLPAWDLNTLEGHLEMWRFFKDHPRLSFRYDVHTPLTPGYMSKHWTITLKAAKEELPSRAFLSIAAERDFQSARRDRWLDEMTKQSIMMPVYPNYFVRIAGTLFLPFEENYDVYNYLMGAFANLERIDALSTCYGNPMIYPISRWWHFAIVESRLKEPLWIMVRSPDGVVFPMTPGVLDKFLVHQFPRN